MEKKKLLVAASAEISANAIRHYLPDLSNALNEMDIAVLEGNAALFAEVTHRWPSAAKVSGKSKASFRRLLEECAHLVLFWDGEDLTKLLFEARLQGVPTKVIPLQITRVVNKQLTENYDVYIGRGSPWGNPFAMGHGDGPDRAEVIQRYEEYFEEKLTSDPAFKRGLLGLRGLRLACFCKPQACHGDVIAAYLDRILTAENDSKEEVNQPDNVGRMYANQEDSGPS